MLRRSLLVASLVSVFALSLTGRAYANLITNGDFAVFVPSNGTGGGWSTFHIDGAGGWRSSSGNPDEMFILNDGGALATDPTIEQLVTGLTPGATYLLTGDYANVYNCCGSRGANTFAVDVDGANVDKLDFPGVGVWGSFAFNIVAPDTDLLIALRAEIDGDDTEYKVDNISLVQVAAPSAPEPATIALLLTGGVAVARRVRRQRRR